jgi:HPt (histidine-containing phosphotransfer) domain-containing protein
MIRKWLPRAAEIRRHAAESGESDLPDSASAPTAERSTVSAPLDLDRFIKIVGDDDPAYIRQMLRIFWETMLDTPDLLREFAEARDVKALVGEAHNAKGAAASACADVLSDLCKQLESAAHGEDWDKVEALLPKIDQAFDEVGEFIALEARSNADLEQVNYG